MAFQLVPVWFLLEAYRFWSLPTLLLQSLVAVTDLIGFLKGLLDCRMRRGARFPQGWMWRMLRGDPRNPEQLGFAASGNLSSPHTVSLVPVGGCRR